MSWGTLHALVAVGETSCSGEPGMVYVMGDTPCSGGTNSTVSICA
jgi:hypothetical protein